MRRYIIYYPLPGRNSKVSIITSFVESPGRALAYVLKLKPYLLYRLGDVTIKPWNRACEQC